MLTTVQLSGGPKNSEMQGFFLRHVMADTLTLNQESQIMPTHLSALCLESFQNVWLQITVTKVELPSSAWLGLAQLGKFQLKLITKKWYITVKLNCNTFLTLRASEE